MARYNHYTFLESIKTPTQDIIYYDVFSPKWTGFNYTLNTIEHTLTASECDRFYLVSQRYYASVEFADILFLINGLTDPFSLKPGIKLTIPVFDDIILIRDKMLNPTSNENNAIIE